MIWILPIVICSLGLAWGAASRYSTWIVVGLYMVNAVSVLMMAFTLPGTPRSVSMTFDVREYPVLAHVSVPKEAIYMWVVDEEQQEPLSIKMPWSREGQEALGRMGEESEQTGKQLRMNMGEARNENQADAVFYLAPHEPDPPKPGVERG